MMRPLNFEKLDVLTSSDTLCLIKNANRVLSICEVILEIKRFVVHSADGIREATPELRDVDLAFWKDVGVVPTGRQPLLV